MAWKPNLDCCLFLNGLQTKNGFAFFKWLKKTPKKNSISWLQKIVWNSNFSVYDEVSLEHGHAQSFVYFLWLLFMLQRQSLVVVELSVWPSLNYITYLALYRKICLAHRWTIIFCWMNGWILAYTTTEESKLEIFQQSGLENLSLIGCLIKISSMIVW